MRIVGLDLSLASTGMATIHIPGPTEVAQHTSKPTGTDLHHRATRLSRIVDRILTEVVFGLDPTITVVEGPSYGQTRQGGQHDRAGLWWLVVDGLIQAEVPVAEIPPALVKRYATGKGNASKDAVLAAVVRRFSEVEVTGNDQADALVLAAMAADHLGSPIATVPAANRAALDKVAWPELGSAP